MTARQYRPVYQWFSARPAALRALRVFNMALPALSVALYPVLLAMLALRAVRALQLQDSVALAAAVQELARAVLTPGLAFVAGSAARRLLNRPRPYQQPGFVPLVAKQTAGRSFPSRHALSAAVIAMAWLRASRPVGCVLLAAAAGVCATRVLAGVHHGRDVAAGAAFGLACGALGMFVL